MTSVSIKQINLKVFKAYDFNVIGQLCFTRQCNTNMYNLRNCFVFTRNLRVSNKNCKRSSAQPHCK